LLEQGGLDALIAVAEAGYCGAACGIEDGLAVGEVKVVALCGDDLVGVEVQGAVEDGGFVLRLFGHETVDVGGGVATFVGQLDGRHVGW